MAELVTALDDARASRGRLVMLVGEPGIGKSRTAQELAALAERRGAIVLWGRCPEQPGAPPFWPWVQVVRTLADGLDDEALRACLGAGAADVAGLLPELRGRLPGLPWPSHGQDAESARFRLFDAIAFLLKRAADRVPLVLVLDNLQWADGSSLRLLEFIAPEIVEARVLVLGTYRDIELSRRHPLADTLGNLTRERHFMRLALRGLSPGDVGGLLEATLGTAPSPELADAVFSRTEGNPLFVHEVARLLLQEGATPGRGSPGDLHLRIPEGIRDVIGQRLNKLSDKANEALAVASVIGRDFDVNSFAGVSDGAPDGALLGALEEAVRARLVDEDPRVRGRYRFSHALVRQILYEELSTTRRVRLHLRLAETFERLYGNAASEHAAELAHHFGEAQLAGGASGMVKYSVLAGKNSMAAHAWEEAVDHFLRALAANQTTPTDSETASVLVMLGRAQSWLYLFEESAASFKRAFDFYRDNGDIARAIEVVDSPQNVPWVLPFIAAQLEEALRMVPEGSAQSAGLYITYGLAQGVKAGGYGRSQSALERGLAVAQQAGSDSLRVRALAAKGNVCAAHGRWQESLIHDDAVLELATNVEDQASRMETLFRRSLALIYLGHPEEAEGPAAELLRISLSQRNRRWLRNSYAALFVRNLALGDWRAAHESLEAWYGITNQIDRTNLKARRSYISFVLGDREPGQTHLDEALADLQPHVRKMRGVFFIYARIAHITGIDSFLPEIESAAAMRAGDLNLHTQYVRDARFTLGLISVVRRDAHAAQTSYDLLREESGMTFYGEASVERLLALLAQTAGDIEAARKHFEDALQYLRPAGYRPELAWTCHDYAEMLLATRTTADSKGAAKAKSLLDEGEPLATELGMKPLAAKLASLREKFVARRGGRLDYPDGLTEREVDVLRLIAAGKSNREIGEALVISGHTVMRHVANILAKTGLSNRAGASAYAVRNGLAPR